jgi:hypothetical protein
MNNTTENPMISQIGDGHVMDSLLRISKNLKPNMTIQLMKWIFLILLIILISILLIYLPY